MALTEKYTPAEAELRIARQWQAQGVYDFDRNSQKPVYSINTPPATVSGHLHLGHIYSYVQTDFIARFWRMNGCNVFYPMGYDDNGLPTDRLVQRVKKVTPEQIGRNAFKQACLEFSQEAEVEYQTLWQRLGLSVDWSYTYRTVNDLAKQRLYSESVAQGESARFCMAVLLRPIETPRAVLPLHHRRAVPGPVSGVIRRPVYPPVCLAQCRCAVSFTGSRFNRRDAGVHRHRHAPLQKRKQFTPGFSPGSGTIGL